MSFLQSQWLGNLRPPNIEAQARRTCGSGVRPERQPALPEAIWLARVSCFLVTTLLAWAATLSGLGALRAGTQGSSFLATLGWRPESRWDSKRPTLWVRRAGPLASK